MMRIVAKFHPQAWVNDQAIEVDPEGNTEFDVTADVLMMSMHQVLYMKDNQHSSDVLRTISKNVPLWIMEWNGPFWIEVEDSIKQLILGELQ